MKVYKSYGVLAHEKQPVYTADGPASEIYDEVEVNLPAGWELAKNYYDATLICSPDGVSYLAREILTNWGDEPALVWCDAGGRKRRIVLKADV